MTWSPALGFHTLHKAPWYHFLWGPLGKAMDARPTLGSLEEQGEGK